MSGDCFQVLNHFGEPAGLSAAGGGFDEVQQSLPAHETVERRVVVVEDRPQVLEGIVVPSIAEGGGAASEVRGRE